MSNHVFRVLVVDDDPADGKLMSDLLGESESGTFAVDVATDVAQARAALHGDAYDILLCDYNLGDESGIDLMIDLHASGRFLPTIITSGQAEASIQHRARQAGAVGFLHKRTITTEGLERTILFALAAAGKADAADRNDPLRMIVMLTEKSVQAQMDTKHEIQGLRGDIRTEVGRMRSDLDALKATVGAHHDQHLTNHRAAMVAIEGAGQPSWQKALSWAAKNPTQAMVGVFILIALVLVAAVATRIVDMSVLRVVRP